MLISLVDYIVVRELDGAPFSENLDAFLLLKFKVSSQLIYIV